MTRENEGEAKRRAIDSFNRQDAINILGLTNNLQAWLEGDERLSIKEAQMLVKAIPDSAENIQTRIDFL